MVFPLSDATLLDIPLRDSKIRTQITIKHESGCALQDLSKVGKRKKTAEVEQKTQIGKWHTFH
eukprot:2875407-Amphidinium_carterae.1